MSISITLTEEQRSLLHVVLGIAIRRFKENAEVFSDGSSADYNNRLAEQFAKQAEDAENRTIQQEAQRHHPIGVPVDAGEVDELVGTRERDRGYSVGGRGADRGECHARISGFSGA